MQRDARRGSHAPVIGRKGGTGPRRTAALRRRRWGLAAAAAVVALVASELVVLPARPAAAQPRPAPVREVPALASPAQTRMEPEVPKGDFNDRPPHPEQLENVRPARGNGFHPDKSQVVDEENTETKKVYRNADGTTTEAISLRPSRYRAEGGWRDIDFGLVPGPEATLQARSAPRPVRLAGKADGPSSVDTPSGPIVLRHRGASSTAAVVDGATATYPGALGGRDLKMVLTDEGFKESMIVPNPAAGGSYVDEFTLPQGVTARQGDRGVESVDLAGEVVARFHDGWAFDASPEPRPPAAVSVRLVSEEPTPERSAPAAPTESTPPADAPATSPPDPAPSNRSASPRPSSPPTTSRTAVVEVGVDPAWLADPARVFPVTIDPSVTVGFLRGG